MTDENVSASSRRDTLRAQTTTALPARRPLWESMPNEPSGVPTTSEVIAASPKHTLSAEIEQTLMRVLTGPIATGATCQLDHDNRERELRTCFASLSPIEAYVLRQRLDADRNGDNLAIAFRRLLAERRQRLRSFLADPRRRMAARTA